MKKLLGLYSVIVLVFTLVGCQPEIDCICEDTVFVPCDEQDQQIVEVPVEVIPQDTLDYIAELEAKIESLENPVELDIQKVIAVPYPTADLALDEETQAYVNELKTTIDIFATAVEDSTEYIVVFIMDDSTSYEIIE